MGFKHRGWFDWAPWWASSFGGCDWTMDAAREVDALHVKVQPYLVGAGVFASACIWLDILRSRWRAVHLVIAYVWDLYGTPGS